jgi:hypothetical protein
MKPVRILLAALVLFAGKVHARGELADLTVFDRTEGRRLQVHWHEGRAYVVGKAGNEYRIAVRSRLREDLLAVVSVDGVNVVTGQTAAFYFTSLADAYAARTGRPDNVGVIGVALFRKRHTPAPSPIGRAEPLSRDRAAEARIGTGHGRHESSPAHYVGFERASSAPAQVITLYYDSRANLVARGVIRDAVPVAPHPRPFPGFVPDPAG